MKIGYYAHQHGSGHCRYADKLAKRFNTNSDCSNLTVFTSMSANEYRFQHINKDNIIRLDNEHENPDDVLSGRPGRHWKPDCLHYSPVDSTSIRSRSQVLLTEIQRRQLALMIIDVSVEVALLCRTASIPYLYVRLPGRRDDVPHLNAFAGAIGLLAFYPEILESPDTPQWVRNKTLYLGFLQPKAQTVARDAFISILNQLAKPKSQPLNNQCPTHQSIEPIQNDCDSNHSTLSNKISAAPIVTVIKGYGGHKNVDEVLPIIRQQLPNAVIVSLGPIEPDAIQHVDIEAQVDSVTPFLEHSSLLVMACGLNAIGEACQFSVPLLVIPDDRPHDEQKLMAHTLIKCGRAFDLQTFMDSHLLKSLNTISSRCDASSISQLNPIDPTLLTALRLNYWDEFVHGLATFDRCKAWFEQWLLAQLNCTPEDDLQ